MCYTLVALDMTASVFVPDTEDVQVSPGTLTGVDIHIGMLLTSFSESTPFIWLQFTPKTTVLHDLLRMFAVDS